MGWKARLPALGVLTVLGVAGCIQSAPLHVPDHPNPVEESALRRPTVAAPTTLYIHTATGGDFPMNTQLPPDFVADERLSGMDAQSLDCVADPTGTTSMRDRHTYYAYFAPWYVDYWSNGTGRPAIAPQRGLLEDVHIAPPGIGLTWLMESQWLGSGSPTQPDLNANPVPPAPIPNVVVEATIRTGDALSIGDEAYNEGTVLAHGLTGPVTLAGEQTQQPPKGTVSHEIVEGRHVYQFTVRLDVAAPAVIPRNEGANLRIDVYVDNPACNDPQDKVMPNLLRIHSSPGNRPRLDLLVTNPIFIEYLHPQFVGGQLYLHAESGTPWGGYDVCEAAMEGMKVVCPQVNAESPILAGPNGSFKPRLVGTWQSTEHGELGLRRAFAWDPEADEAAAGLYLATYRIWNDQGTASAESTALFQIGPGTAEGVVYCQAPDVGTVEHACVPRSTDFD